MIGQKQTLAGGADVPLEERGDCLRAAIASIMEIPLSVLPNPHGEGWYDEWQEALYPYGLRLFEIDFTEAEYEFTWPGYWIASVASKNLEGSHPGLEDQGIPILHAVVMQGDRVVWDPSNAHTYDVGKKPGRIYYATLLMALDPVSLSGAHTLYLNNRLALHQEKARRTRDFTG